MNEPAAHELIEFIRDICPGKIFVEESHVLRAVTRVLRIAGTEFGE